jgi:thiol-disulfide isomerase/thioredoxin
MFKWSKPSKSDYIFLGAILILLFTPLGTFVKVQVNRLFAFSPSVIEKADQKKLENYRWILMDNEENRIDFSNQKGRVTIVNYWATWCPPCLAEMPSFQSLYEDYKDRVDFMFVSNEELEITQAYLSRKNYTLPSYKPLSEPPGLLFTESLPTSYLIDKNGNILIKKVGAADWNSAKTRAILDKTLAENP